MSSDIWVVVGVLLAALVAVVTVGVPLWRYWRRPSFYLDVEMARTGEDRLDRDAVAGISMLPSGVAPPASVSSNISTGTGTLMTSSPRQFFAEPIPSLWRWFHIEVTNRGYTKANACRAYLDELADVAPGGVHKVTGWVNRLPLRWANTGGAAEWEIDSGSRARLDLFRIALREAKPVIEFVGAEAHIGLPTVFRRNGRWRVLVILEASNAPTTRAYFEISTERGPDAVSIHKIPLDLLDSSARRVGGTAS
jgi:hypothetical protein